MPCNDVLREIAQIPESSHMLSFHDIDKLDPQRRYARRNFYPPTSQPSMHFGRVIFCRPAIPFEVALNNLMTVNPYDGDNEKVVVKNHRGEFQHGYTWHYFVGKVPQIVTSWHAFLEWEDYPDVRSHWYRNFEVAGRVNDRFWDSLDREEVLVEEPVRDWDELDRLARVREREDAEKAAEEVKKRMWSESPLGDDVQTSKIIEMEDDSDWMMVEISPECVFTTPEKAVNPNLDPALYTLPPPPAQSPTHKRKREERATSVDGANYNGKSSKQPMLLKRFTL